jgi:hypothetical protein
MLRSISSYVQKCIIKNTKHSHPSCLGCFLPLGTVQRISLRIRGAVLESNPSSPLEALRGLSRCIATISLGFFTHSTDKFLGGLGREFCSDDNNLINFLAAKITFNDRTYPISVKGVRPFIVVV